VADPSAHQAATAQVDVLETGGVCVAARLATSVRTGRLAQPGAPKITTYCAQSR
jgi:hypothetical protein